MAAACRSRSAGRDRYQRFRAVMPPPDRLGLARVFGGDDVDAFEPLAPYQWGTINRNGAPWSGSSGSPFMS
jgi:hypothetical protein